MKKILIAVYTIILIILISNFFYYKNLYNKQINYIVQLLNRQVQIVGLTVDNTNNSFLSDLNQISFDEDLKQFFKKPANQYRADILQHFLKCIQCLSGDMLLTPQEYGALGWLTWRKMSYIIFSLRFFRQQAIAGFITACTLMNQAARSEKQLKKAVFQ